MTTSTPQECVGNQSTKSVLRQSPERSRNAHKKVTREQARPHKKLTLAEAMELSRRIKKARRASNAGRRVAVAE